MPIPTLSSIAAFTGRVVGGLKRVSRDPIHHDDDEKEAMSSTAAGSTSRFGMFLRAMGVKSPPAQRDAQQMNTSSTRGRTTGRQDRGEDVRSLPRRSGLCGRRAHQEPRSSASAPRNYLGDIGHQEQDRLCARILAEVLDLCPSYETLPPSVPPPDYDFVVRELWDEYEQEQARRAECERIRRREEADRLLERVLLGLPIHDENYVAPTVWPWQSPWQSPWW